jgi:hypothetical protein
MIMIDAMTMMIRVRWIDDQMYLPFENFSYSSIILQRSAVRGLT